METETISGTGTFGNSAATDHIMENTPMKKIFIPDQLCNPDFRFVPLRPKGQPVGKDKKGNQTFSNGKEPAQA